VLSIPPDFHIEHSLVNVHLWLIVDRLKKINTLESNYMAKHMEYLFRKYSVEKTNRIHLKKKNDFVRDVNHFMLNNRIAYDHHFNKHPITSNNPYIKMDSLIWSTIFFEKVPRYSDVVYLLSEYVIKHFEYFQRLEMSDFLNADIEWDVFRITVNYKAHLQTVNVPLTDEQLKTEVESDAKIKKHYYSYDDPNSELPINTEINNPVDRRFVKINEQVYDTLRKYDNLEKYDFYTERDEKEKEIKKKDAKYVWGSKKASLEKQGNLDDLKKVLSQKK